MLKGSQINVRADKCTFLANVVYKLHTNTIGCNWRERCVYINIYFTVNMVSAKFKQSHH